MNNKLLNKTLPVITLLTYIIMITLNALASILPINGRDTGQISDFYANLFAPAGITFSIWGLIYLLLLGYSIYQFSIYRTKNDKMKNLLIMISFVFTINSIANSFWILAWHYDYILVSLILMLVILSTLIVINIRLRNEKLSFIQHIFIRLPFTVYLGWITVATVANVTTYLVSIGWNRFGIEEYLVTDIIIIVAALIGFIATIYYKSIAYALVIIWAYAGIALKHMSETGFNGEYISVIISVFVSMILIVAAGVIVIRIKLRSSKE